ncbi:hypothetical protein [Virgibacillus siamensis]|uniref:hypothetical protein n=1 Tax=Virgibacillus siamensis TaxID=480071 RepID=UPI00158A60A5|nr:hypothetical protein [Virgibacillus siamensis]
MIQGTREGIDFNDEGRCDLWKHDFKNNGGVMIQESETKRMVPSKNNYIPRLIGRGY